IFGAHMKFSLVRLIATLLLSGEVLPVGLPLLCDQVQRGTPANCEQQMASHPSGPAVAATSHATPCANSAFCAITAPAVVAFGGTVPVSARESHIVGFGVSPLAPADPQAPLPPPPQASPLPSVVCPDAPPPTARAPARSAGNGLATSGMRVRPPLPAGRRFV